MEGWEAMDNKDQKGLVTRDTENKLVVDRRVTVESEIGERIKRNKILVIK